MDSVSPPPSCGDGRGCFNHKLVLMCELKFSCSSLTIRCCSISAQYHRLCMRGDEVTWSLNRSQCGSVRSPCSPRSPAEGDSTNCSFGSLWEHDCTSSIPLSCLSGVHEGDGGLLPPAGLVHPLSRCRDGVQQRRPAGGGGPVGRTVVAGQEAALRRVLRRADSLGQHAEEVRHTVTLYSSGDNLITCLTPEPNNQQTFSLIIIIIIMTYCCLSMSFPFCLHSKHREQWWCEPLQVHTCIRPCEDAAASSSSSSSLLSPTSRHRAVRT